MTNTNHSLRGRLKRFQTILKREWLVVLDLDRTLFDTARFYRDFLGAVTQTWGASLAASMQKVERTGEHLDPFEYLQAQHGIKYEEMVKAFHAYTSFTYPNGTSYLFEDAPKLIAYLLSRPRTYVLIETTGTKQSQQFKLKLCPELASLPCEIISENKGKVLQAEFEQAGGIAYKNRLFSRFVLIDDKASALMPMEVHRRHILVHVLRPDAKFPEHTKRTDIREVGSLADVITVLK